MTPARSTSRSMLLPTSLPTGRLLAATAGPPVPGPVPRTGPRPADGPAPYPRARALRVLRGLRAPAGVPSAAAYPGGYGVPCGAARLHAPHDDVRTGGGSR